ncbi:MAG TPA: hypothetical protein VMW63_07810 [Methanoregulaceae archaeon]|nr:hypothetical protein [Methanoregulaceae archaeon]
MVKAAIIVFAAAFTFMLTIGAAVYASDYGKSEMVHFRVAVPAGNITSPQVIKGAGAPLEMAPIIINLQQRGNLKKVLNPGIEGISTHWITNIGKKPIKIRMELVNASIPVRWEVSANLPFDPDTRTFIEPLPPRESIRNLGIDWFFLIPEDRLYDDIVYEGGLLLSDADTGETLTFLPITVMNGAGMINGSGGDCH